MKVNTPAIVLIAYNRPDSLRRLLSSVSKADYPNDKKVTLIVSIDKSDSDEVVKIANDFNWEYGDKIVLARPERMGLRAHVLACSGLADEYGSVIVLEDDLYVSPSFYLYAMKALDFTEGDDRIGGVSLYNHLFNVHARKSFTAMDDGHDNWYFQLASSWGQAYTKDQWNSFISWYEEHKDSELIAGKIPANVAGWSDKSWLKYYIAYLIDTDKYFLYPKVSFTTNFGDVGSHAVKADADLQVPLAGKVSSLYCSFAKLEKSLAVYDAYFENRNIRIEEENIIHTGVESYNVEMDLYGMKPIDKLINDSTQYVISSQKLPYKQIKSFGRQMRPVDANVVYEVPGVDYYLYDVSDTGSNVISSDSKQTKDSEAIEYLYEYRGISVKQMVKIIKYRILEKIR